MKLFSGTLFLFAVLLSNTLLAIDRPMYLGFSPAYPKEFPEQFTPPSNPPYLTYERPVRIDLDITKKGKVTAVISADAADSLFARYVEKYLLDYKFEPAEFNQKNIDSKLPIKVTFQPGRKYPEFYFPVDSVGNVFDRTFYFDVFRLNGYLPPDLTMFPRYFCDLTWTDTLGLYPFVLIKISLDETGRPTDLHEVNSTYSTYTQTSMSAALWAEYTPALVNDTPVASSCYLLLSYFPQINYPTIKWEAAGIDSMMPLHQARIQLIPDTVGFMQKPLPKKIPGNELTLAAVRVSRPDTVCVRLAVDSTGEVTFQRIGKTGKWQNQVIRDLIEHLRFYPALDYRGNPRYYSGLVHIIFTGSDKIRIDYIW